MNQVLKINEYMLRPKTKIRQHCRSPYHQQIQLPHFGNSRAQWTTLPSCGLSLIHSVTMNNTEQWLANIHNAQSSLANVHNAPSSLVSILLCILPCSANVGRNINMADDFKLWHHWWLILTSVQQLTYITNTAWGFFIKSTNSILWKK